MPRHQNPQERSGGYEDPAQRPASAAPEHGPSDHKDPEDKPGRWPQGTLFVAVVVVLFAGLAILAVLGIIASQ